MEKHVRVTVELELEATPIAGEVSTGTWPGRPFHGWLELAAVIEGLRTGSHGTTTPPGVGGSKARLVESSELR